MERKWWQKEVVYQIYPKSFYDSNNDGIGDIPGIIEKLDYLHELGVTMLWICPFFKSPMDDNGYDISDYYELAPEFGNKEDLDELINRAKGLGIKIIMDLVLNHTSDEHPWFQEAIKNPGSEYHDFYIFKDGTEPINNWRSVFGGSVWESVSNQNEMYLHCFGKKQADLNWENPKLRETLYEMINYWLAKGIAGFRVDAITFIKKDLSFASREADGIDGLVKCTKTCRNQPGIGAFLQELNERCFKKYDCVTVAEAAGVSYDELNEFIGNSGYFSMIFDFKYADLDVASGSEWFKRLDWTVKELKDKIMESQLAMQKYGWAANFIENHDQPRATTKYLKEAATNQDAVKMLGAMYFFLRGTPFIYQGQELGMTNFEWECIEDFNDISSIDQYYRSMEEGLTKKEALKVINLRSRDNSRTPFPWSDETFGGFSKVTPWLKMNDNYHMINVKKQFNDAESVFSFYQKMIKLRQESIYSDLLIYGDIEPLEAPEQVIAYKRRLGIQEINCYYNFSDQEIEIKISKQGAYPIFNNLKEVEIKENTLILKAYQALLIQ
ncbi:alpha-glucosidase [Thomasclavelia sp.]